MAKNNKPKQPTIDELEKEYRKLMQIDRKKAGEIKKKIDYFNYGIK